VSRGRARVGVVWGAVLVASLMVPSPMIAAVAAVDSGDEPFRSARTTSSSEILARGPRGSSPQRLGGATLMQVNDRHGAANPAAVDLRLAGCRWWEPWCKAPVQRCAKTGSQWAVVGAVGGGVAGVWTGPTVAVAAGAAGIGGAISGCLSGIFKW
jgi:hypothetical protein